MALGDCFPTDLVNVDDFTITRPTSTGRWGDDSSGTPATILGPVDAIVIRKTDLIRGVDGEELSLQADAYLDPTTPGLADVRQKDRAAWSDFVGASSNEEVQVVEPSSGVDGLEHVRIRLGRRIA